VIKKQSDTSVWL